MAPAVLLLVLLLLLLLLVFLAELVDTLQPRVVDY
jgi:hypothetical protein